MKRLTFFDRSDYMTFDSLSPVSIVHFYAKQSFHTKVWHQVNKGQSAKQG